MTHEQYVSLSTAKLLKQAGFNWECNRFYREVAGDILIGTITTDHNNVHNTRNDIRYSAPTQAVAQRWLREVKGYHIYITHTFTAQENKVSSVWECLVEKMSFLKPNSVRIMEDDLGRSIVFPTYEAALEAGLQKCLTLLIEKQ